MFDELYGYLKKLQEHDWTYEWSDCHATWKRGQLNQLVLVCEAHANPEKLRLYYAFNECYTPGCSVNFRDIELLRETVNSIVP
jgi:hypothetical protein